MEEDQELKKILSICSVSTKAVAKTFFPERFYAPFAENVHGKVSRIKELTNAQRPSTRNF